MTASIFDLQGKTAVVVSGPPGTKLLLTDLNADLLDSAEREREFRASGVNQ